MRYGNILQGDNEMVNRPNEGMILNKFEFYFKCGACQSYSTSYGAGRQEYTVHEP